jgi:hypothetical protein
VAVVVVEIAEAWEASTEASERAAIMRINATMDDAVRVEKDMMLLVCFGQQQNCGLLLPQQG